MFVTNLDVTVKAWGTSRQTKKIWKRSWNNFSANTEPSRISPLKEQRKETINLLLWSITWEMMEKKQWGSKWWIELVWTELLWKGRLWRWSFKMIQKEERTQSKRWDRFSVGCYTCGKKGHFARECRSNKNGED